MAPIATPWGPSSVLLDLLRTPGTDDERRFAVLPPHLWTACRPCRQLTKSQYLHVLLYSFYHQLIPASSWTSKAQTVCHPFKRLHPSLINPSSPSSVGDICGERRIFIFVNINKKPWSSGRVLKTPSSSFPASSLRLHGWLRRRIVSSEVYLPSPWTQQQHGSKTTFNNRTYPDRLGHCIIYIIHPQHPQHLEHLILRNDIHPIGRSLTC